MARDRAYKARVVSSEPITSPESDDEVRELVMDIEAPEFPVRGGESIGVLTPDGDPSRARLYSAADRPSVGEDGKPRITICVKRCSYPKTFDREAARGLTSNYLCDLKPGDTLSVTGPYGIAFEKPSEDDATLILIGAGTGIAPFRALVKQLYHERPDWKGRVWLFHGARTGLEMLYMNDQRDDFAEYVDKDTFEAFKALSPSPNWADPIAWDMAFAERGDEIWRMLGEPNTYVYIAGLAGHHGALDDVFISRAGSRGKWEARKAELIAARRWVELLY